MSQERYSDEELLAQLQHSKEEHGRVTPRLFNQMDDTASASAVMRRFGGWSTAKEKAGIDEDLQHLTGRKQEYSDEQILDNIRECARRNDGRCTVTLLQDEEDLVSPSVAVERFGRWSTAKEQAGVDKEGRSRNARPREYSDEDYLNFIEKCKQEHGKVTQRLFNEIAKERDNHPTAGAVRKRFGKWSTALKKAGVDNGAQRYSTEELLDQLRVCEEKYGNCSASKFASDDEFASPETIQRRFGSWKEGKEKAEIS